MAPTEAPPAIISAYLGSYLSKVLDEVEERVKDKFNEQDEAILKLDLHKQIPELLMDNTDRNRTSPFAFTGNKFEFRAVGSSANCAGPMTVLNTIVAETLKNFKTEVDGLVGKGEKKEIAVLHVLRNYIRDSKKVRFEGDNYSEEWAAEAEGRGLSNFKTTPEALQAYVSDAAKHVFYSNNIFSERELEARYEIMLEEYVKKVQIEARILGYLATNHVLPAAIEYQNKLIANITGLKNIGMPEEAYRAQKNLVGVISGHIQKINDYVEAMIEARKQANEEASMHERAQAYCDDVKSYFEQIRWHADKLELIVEDKLWPLPKYRELLFLR